jgi:hypothetical protein
VPTSAAARSAMKGICRRVIMPTRYVHGAIPWRIPAPCVGLAQFARTMMANGRTLRIG